MASEAARGGRPRRRGEFATGQRPRTRPQAPHQRSRRAVAARQPSDRGALSGALLGEELRVQLERVPELVGEQGLREDRVDRARLHAGVAVDADLRIDVKLLRRLKIGRPRLRMDAVDGADIDARVVLDAAAGDEICHGSAKGYGSASWPPHSV